MAEPPSSIPLTTRDDVSIPLRIVQQLAKPFRPRLLAPTKVYPPGSPELSPSWFAKRYCDVAHRQVEGIHIYDLTLKKSKSKSKQGQSVDQPDSATLKEEEKKKKQIYYFAGGGWQSPPTVHHWAFCAQLVQRLNDDKPTTTTTTTTVSIVSTPLAPASPAPTTFPQLLRLYRALCASAAASNTTLLLAGDSSGGNLILALTLEALREDDAAGLLPPSPSTTTPTTPPHPTALLPLSPATDLTHAHPTHHLLAPADPFLTPSLAASLARSWASSSWDLRDPRLSPQYAADLSLLRRGGGVRVYGVTAGRDVLGPEALAWRARAAEEGVRGAWLDWKGVGHCFVLMGWVGVREGVAGVEWVVERVREC